MKMSQEYSKEFSPKKTNAVAYGKGVSRMSNIIRQKCPRNFQRSFKKSSHQNCRISERKFLRNYKWQPKKNTERIPSLIYGISEENHENKSQEIAENISQFSNYFQSNLFKIPVTELP